MLLTLCAFIATACEIPENNNSNQTEQTEQPDQTATPEIIITSNDKISVGSGNAQGIITYSIENAVEELSIVATSDVEWIHSLNYANSGKIDFAIKANDLYESRVGTITLTYGEATAIVTITQAGMVRPEEIAITAPYLLGHYFGDYANDAYNYYIVLSESNYDANNSFYAGGWKFFLDIYSTVYPTDYSNIRIPNGVYTFNPNNDGKAGTFLESYSLYKEYNASGYEVNERQYASGTLTVTDDLVKLEVTFTDDTNIYVVTYSGDYTILDQRHLSGSQN